MFDPEAPAPIPQHSGQSRRNILRWGALGAAGVVAAACSTGSSSSPAATAAASSGSSSASTTSLLDQWVSTKKATFGVDLTAPPLQYKDSSGKPTGYLPELLNMMM